MAWQSSGSRVAGKWMDCIVVDLLRLSRSGRTALVMGGVDLPSLVTTILLNLSGQQPGRKKVILVSEGLIARCDRPLVQSTIENKPDNAWKYTRNIEETRTTFGSMRNDGETRYFIRDNGAGFVTKKSGKPAHARFKVPYEIRIPW